jgi:type I restriction enzyme S subunit
MSKYQFACDFMSPIRVNKLPVVLKLDDEPNLVSPAYPVFEIKDRNELDPEYLMMWFRRTEFDRYATFKCDAAIRGGYEWTELCETLIPVPSITKQKEIVKEYNVIQNRIALNQQLIQKLEETAQAIYKQWFVEFEFPDETGKPYKSNGGEMVWNEELGKEIPKGWEGQLFSKYCDFINGYSYKGDELQSSKTAMISIKNFDKNGGFKTEGLKEIIPNKIRANCYANIGDVLVAHTDLTQGVIIGNPTIVMNKSIYDFLIFSMDTVKVLSKVNEISNCLLYCILKDKRFKEFSLGYVNGSTVMHLSKSALAEFKIFLPENLEVITQLSLKLDKVLFHQINLHSQIEKLQELKSLLLSKLATIK